MPRYHIMLRVLANVTVDADTAEDALALANANAQDEILQSIADGRWSVVDSELAPFQ